MLKTDKKQHLRWFAGQDDADNFQSGSKSYGSTGKKRL